MCKKEDHTSLVRVSGKKVRREKILVEPLKDKNYRTILTETP